MRYAILSDIHSNLEALEVSLDYLSKERIDEYLILGDVIGYGANPNECLEIVSRLPGKIVAGNHEKAVLDPELAACFTHHAHEAIDWTSHVLEEKWIPYLEEMPYLHIAATYTLAHGSIHSPRDFHYMYYFADAVPSFECMKTPLGFVGHTHVPEVFRKSKRDAEHWEPGTVSLNKGESYIVNPGSVGQPRDRDTRLSFALWDDEKKEVSLLRLDYDNQKAAKKIRDAGLPRFLADRLL